MGKTIELLPGEEYGRLKIIGMRRNKKGARYWLCQCRCGKKVKADAWNLVHGAVVSCGCKKIEEAIKRIYKHGEGRDGNKTPEYKAWENMISRCSKTSPSYEHYAARGIAVCQRWRESYLNFLEDMGRRPSPKHELDRKDNDKGYEPSNCRWATRAEQIRNRRCSFKITVEGEIKTAYEWSDISGIHPETIKCRILAGWDPKEAVSKKVQRKKPVVWKR